MIGIDPDLDGLYDPQQRPPAGWCPVCGREIYAYGENLCTRCRESDVPGNGLPRETHGPGF